MDYDDTTIPDFSSVLSGGEVESHQSYKLNPSTHKSVADKRMSPASIGSGSARHFQDTMEKGDAVIDDQGLDTGSNNIRYETETETETESESDSESDCESDSESDSESGPESEACEQHEDEDGGEVQDQDQDQQKEEEEEEYEYEYEDEDEDTDQDDDGDGDGDDDESESEDEHGFEDQDENEVCYEDTDLGGEDVSPASLIAASLVAGGSAVRSGTGWSWTSILIIVSAAGGLGIILLYALKRINELTRLVKMMEENSHMAMNERDVQVITTRVIEDMLQDSDETDGSDQVQESHNVSQSGDKEEQQLKEKQDVSVAHVFKNDDDVCNRGVDVDIDDGDGENGDADGDADGDEGADQGADENGDQTTIAQDADDNDHSIDVEDELLIEEDILVEDGSVRDDVDVVDVDDLAAMVNTMSLSETKTGKATTPPTTRASSRLIADKSLDEN